MPAVDEFGGQHEQQHEQEQRRHPASRPSVDVSTSSVFERHALEHVGDVLAAIHRVFENLIANAAKYAPEGPIDVRVALEADRAVIEVADRGPGIAPADRARVLERFVRLEGSRSRPGCARTRTRPTCAWSTTSAATRPRPGPISSTQASCHPASKARRWSASRP